MNIFTANEIVATVITVILFAILAILLVKREEFFEGVERDNFFAGYIIIVTLVLCGINLFPFDISIDSSIITVIVQMLFVGLMEEIIFRGCVYKVCYIRFGAMKAIIISSILFGLMHTINILSADILMVVMQVIYSMSIGIVFAGLIYKKQGIHMCVLIHSIINISAHLGATDSAIKEMIFSIACMCLAIVMLLRLNILKQQCGGKK